MSNESKWTRISKLLRKVVRGESSESSINKAMLDTVLVESIDWNTEIQKWMADSETNQVIHFPDGEYNFGGILEWQEKLDDELGNSTK